ncbi:MAG: Rha family transcriptional regulator [Lachnospiraceae bacterium]|nr:Rha family transcriptional regulator [Lachnospiraceae bacterium]MCM1240452.1 Rha family transcriptional regulator [Lachnospiraceae bacterium]
MLELEQTLDSREVAEMIEKNHKDLIRDIKRYIKQMNEVNEENTNERNLAPVEFFKESTYVDAKGETRPCYRITKKGCEFIAHKLTGTKGTTFTARYINKFHEMENTLAAGGGLEGLAELRAAVEAQGRLLHHIDKQLSHNRMIGTGGTTEEDRYRTEIVRMAKAMDSVEALRKVFTFAKYVPQ